MSPSALDNLAVGREGAPATVRSRREVKVSQLDSDAVIEGAQSADSVARDRLFGMMYGELRRMAQRALRRGAGATLSPTTLLHETFLNISQRQSVSFASRGEFMSYASRAMRGLIIDYVRNRQARKRGGGYEITSLPTEVASVQLPDNEWMELEQLNRALQSLAEFDPRLAECVDLKFFCGLSFNEIARLREVSERTIQRDWRKARMLLYRLMNEQQGSEDSPNSLLPAS